MSRNEIHINSAHLLIQARKEALERMNRIPMKSHGQVLGKDLFSWFDYRTEDLVNIIDGFPYPVHWIATKNEVIAAFRHDEKIIDKFETIAIYDSPKFELKHDFAERIKNCISTDSIQGALTMIRAVEKQSSELLITGDLQNVQQNEKHIEAFIKTFNN